MYSVINLFLAFVAGALYAVCAGAFYTSVVDRPRLCKRWYSWPALVRMALLVAWPVSACWMFA